MRATIVVGLLALAVVGCASQPIETTETRRELAVTVRMEGTAAANAAQTPRFHVEGRLETYGWAAGPGAAAYSAETFYFPDAAGVLGEEIVSAVYTMHTPRERVVVCTSEGHLAFGPAVDEGQMLKVRVGDFDLSTQSGTLTVDCIAKTRTGTPFVMRKARVPFHAAEELRFRDGQPQELDAPPNGK